MQHFLFTSTHSEFIPVINIEDDAKDVSGKQEMANDYSLKINRHGLVRSPLKLMSAIVCLKRSQSCNLEIQLKDGSIQSLLTDRSQACFIGARLVLIK